MGNIGNDVPHRWQGGHLSEDGFPPGSDLQSTCHAPPSGKRRLKLVSEIDSFLIPVYGPIAMPCDVRKLANVLPRTRTN